MVNKIVVKKAAKLNTNDADEMWGQRQSRFLDPSKKSDSNRISKKKIVSNKRSASQDDDIENQKVAGESTGFFSVTRQMLKSASSKRTGFWVAVGCCCFIFLLGLIALILYLALWVDVPDVNVKGLVGDPKDQRPGQVSLGANPSFNMSVKVDVDIKNPNRIDLAFDYVNVFISNQVLPDYALSTSQLNNLYLPKTSVTPMQIPLDLTFSFAADNSGVIPQDLIASCSIPKGKDKPEKQLTFIIKIDAKLRVTDLIKIQIPTIVRTYSLDCPQTFDSSIDVAGYQVNVTQIDWNQIAKGQFATLPSQ